MVARLPWLRRIDLFRSRSRSRIKSKRETTLDCNSGIDEASEGSFVIRTFVKDEEERLAGERSEGRVYALACSRSSALSRGLPSEETYAANDVTGAWVAAAVSCTRNEVRRADQNGSRGE